MPEVSGIRGCGCQRIRLTALKLLAADELALLPDMA
jgi:hypothetical protein